MADLETLKLNIVSDSSTATAPITQLSTALTGLKTATSGSTSGLTKTAAGLSSIATAAKGLNSSSISNLNLLTTSIKNLESVSGVKISSTLAKNITSLNTSLNGLSSEAATKLTALGNALTPLTELGKSNLGTFVTQLGKLKDVANELDNTDIDKFTAQIEQLTAAITPFATEMEKVSAGFSAFPTKIQKLVSSTNTYNTSMTGSTAATVSFSTAVATLIAKIYLLKRAFDVIGSWITSSNDYQETLNLFTASMGEFADSAYEYAETVSEVMGINIADWIYNQGIFNTLATGLGVVSEDAALMSKNLTQLGYDISSFFNLTVDESMQKLQSAISGELEPVRNIGYALSQNSLQELYDSETLEQYTEQVDELSLTFTDAEIEALGLANGIDKTISEMTEAEKVYIRYIALMEQNSVVQGDMARTLESPANQLRILTAQLEMAGQAIGNIFIPALNSILPYAIAVVKAVREIANAIANLFGFELTEVDYSDISIELGTEDAASDLSDVSDSLEEIQSYTMGFDELNVLSESDSSSSSDTDYSSGSFDWDLSDYDYDFISDAVSTNVDNILASFEPVISWIEEHLEDIIKLVQVIGLGLLAWTISKSLTTGLVGLVSLLTGAKALSLATAVALTVTGVVLEVDAIFDIIENGIDPINFAEGIGGALFTTAGMAALGAYITTKITTVFAGSALATAITSAAKTLGFSTVSALGATIAGGIGAIIAGIPLYIVGIYDALKNGISALSASLIAFGATLGGAGIGALIGALGGPIGVALGALIGLIVGALTDIAIYVYQNWEEVSAIISNVFASIKSLFQSELNSALEMLKNFSDANLITIANGISAAKTLFDGLVTFISGVFSGDWELAWIGIQEIFKGVFEGLETIAKAPLNGVIALLNAFVDRTNTIIGYLNSFNVEIPDWLSGIVGGGSFSFSIPTIPKISYFADGGFPSVGELFIANEAGPELIGTIGGKNAVANNDQITTGIAEAVYNAMISAMNSSSGSSDINLTSKLVLDGQEIYVNQEKVKRERGQNVGMGVFAR